MPLVTFSLGHFICSPIDFYPLGTQYYIDSLSWSHVLLKMISPEFFTRIRKFTNTPWEIAGDIYTHLPQYMCLDGTPCSQCSLSRSKRYAYLSELYLSLCVYAYLLGGRETQHVGWQNKKLFLNHCIFAFFYYYDHHTHIHTRLVGLI